MKKKKIGLLLFRKGMENNEASDIRFQEEIEKLGFESEFLNYQRFAVFLEKDAIEIFYDNKPFNADSFLFLIGKYNSLNGNLSSLSLANFLLKAGVKVFNSFQSAMFAKSKRETALLLSQNGLPIIPTGINYSQFYLDEHLKRNKDKKIVAKGNVGSIGYEVAVLDSHISFISFMEMVGNSSIKPFDVLIQPFIEAKGEDFRLFVVGGKVIAAMKRKAMGIEFRSNIHKGGRGKAIKPSKEMTGMALKAVKLLGLDYAGVDVIKDKRGKLMIVEVNSNPGLEIEKITGVNVVEKVVRYGISKSRK